MGGERARGEGEERRKKNEPKNLLLSFFLSLPSIFTFPDHWGSIVNLFDDDGDDLSSTARKIPGQMRSSSFPFFCTSECSTGTSLGLSGAVLRLFPNGGDVS